MPRSANPSFVRDLKQKQIELIWIRDVPLGDYTVTWPVQYIIWIMFEL